MSWIVLHMIFLIHKQIFCTKFGGILEQSKIQKTDMYGRLGVEVIIATVEIVIDSAQVAE